MVETLANIPTENRWREQIHPVPIVISIIRRIDATEADGGGEESFLLIKRKTGPYRDFWALVGGKWDFGESLSNAALREVKEETGMSGTFGALLGMVNERVVLDEEKRPGAAHFLIFVCCVNAGAGQAEEQEEGAVAWFTRDDIKRLDDSSEIIPSDFAMLSHFINQRALPYIEVEMESVSAREGHPGSTKLTRFDLMN